MSGIREKFDKLKSSSNFKEWSDDRGDAYLVSIFFLKKPGRKVEEIVFDFYEPTKDRITSFSVKEGAISRTENLEILKEKADSLKELNIDTLDIDESFEHAIAKAEEVLNKDSRDFVEVFATLQTLDEEPVWNLTFPIIREFKVVNVKVSCRNNKILSNELMNIFEFRKR